MRGGSCRWGRGARAARTAGGAGASAPASESTSAELSERARATGGACGWWRAPLSLSAPPGQEQGSNAFGVWCVWGVSLTLDVRLKPTGGRSGAGIRKHVEPFSVQVQGGSSPPWRTRFCPLKTPSPLLFRFGGMFQTTPDAAPCAQNGDTPTGSQESLSVCSHRGGYLPPGCSRAERPDFPPVCSATP